MAISLKKTLSEIASAILKMEYRELLWTNKNVDSAFAPATINIAGIDDYQDFEIVYLAYYNSGITHQYKSVRFDMSKPITIEAVEAGSDSWLSWVNTRVVIKTSDGLKFDDGWCKNQNAQGFDKNNSAIIPYKIYGTKKYGVGGVVVNRLAPLYYRRNYQKQIALKLGGVL